MPPSFKEQLAAAREWERKIAAACQKQGYYVVPSFDFSGPDGDRAPSMSAPPGEQSAVLPDIQLFLNGKNFWLEVKTKTTWSKWGHGNYHVTGCDLLHFEAYQRVEQESGAKGYIVFVHLEQREMRGDSLARLANNESHRWEPKDKPKRSHMVYWRYDRIPRWGSIALPGDGAVPVVQFAQPFAESPELPPRARPAPSIGKLRPLVSAPRPKPVVMQTDFFDVLDQPKRAGGGKR